MHEHVHWQFLYHSSWVSELAMIAVLWKNTFTLTAALSTQKYHWVLSLHLTSSLLIYINVYFYLSAMYSRISDFLVFALFQEIVAK